MPFLKAEAGTADYPPGEVWQGAEHARCLLQLLDPDFPRVQPQILRQPDGL